MREEFHAGMREAGNTYGISDSSFGELLYAGDIAGLANADKHGVAVLAEVEAVTRVCGFRLSADTLECVLVGATMGLQGRWCRWGH